MSETQETKHIADIVEGAIVAHARVACQSDLDRAVLDWSIASFADLLPDDAFCERLEMLLLGSVARMPQPLLCTVSERASRLAMKGDMISRLAHLQAFLTPLERPDTLNTQVVQLLIQLSDAVLSDGMGPAALLAPASESQSAPPQITALLKNADIWKLVFDIHAKIRWDQLPKASDDRLIDVFLDKISTAQPVLADEKHRICDGALLIDTLLFYEQCLTQFRVLDPTNTVLSERLNHWSQACREIEASEQTLVDFLKTCVPQSKFLREALAPLREQFETFTSHRCTAQHISTWKSFPLATECHTEMRFVLQAMRSKSAQHLWKEIGCDSSGDLAQSGVEGAEHMCVAEEKLIKKVHDLFSTMLRDLLMTIDRGRQANSSLKPFIESLQRDVQPPAPPPKGLGQKEARLQNFLDTVHSQISNTQQPTSAKYITKQWLAHVNFPGARFHRGEPAKVSFRGTEPRRGWASLNYFKVVVVITVQMPFKESRSR